MFLIKSYQIKQQNDLKIIHENTLRLNFRIKKQKLFLKSKI